MDVVNFNRILLNINLGFNANNVFTKYFLQPVVEFHWDVEVIGSVQQKLIEQNLKTTHLVCVGGWNAPHPDTSCSGKQWFEVGCTLKKITYDVYFCKTQH